MQQLIIVIGLGVHTHASLTLYSSPLCLSVSLSLLCAPLTPPCVSSGALGSAVPPPLGAPKLKKLILRAKHLRISPDGQVELMEP